LKRRHRPQCPFPKPRPLPRTLAKVHKNYRVKNIVGKKNFILIAGYFFSTGLQATWSEWKRGLPGGTRGVRRKKWTQICVRC